MPHNNPPRRNPRKGVGPIIVSKDRPAELLLPGAFLMAMLTQLLASLVPVDFRLPAFFE
jgi:hypothetical protein